MNETLPPPPAPTTPTADKAKITGKQKTIIAVAALLALGIFGTFANNSEAAVDDEPAKLNASEAVEETKPEPEPEVESDYELTRDDKEYVYLTLFRQEVSFESVLTDDEAIEFGHMACGVLDSGVSLVDFLLEAAMLDSALNPGDVATIAGLAIPAFCPEHRWQIDALPG